MKAVDTALPLYGLALLMLACAPEPPARDDLAAIPEYQVADWPKLPAGFTFGQVVGVGVDSQDRVFVFHRAGADFKNEELITRPTVAVIDAMSGELLDEWGANLFVVPHGLSVDAQDHIWVTDVGANTVVELLADGSVVQVLHGDES